METQTIQMFDSSDWSLGSTADYEGGGPLLPLGNYTLELIGKGPDEPQKPEYDPEGKKRRAQFTFEVVEDTNDHVDDAGNPVSYVGTRIKPFYTISLHEKSKLRPVVEALMGGKLQRDQRVGADLIGRRMKATIQHGTAESTGKPYAYIAAALPVRPPRTTKAAA